MDALKQLSLVLVCHLFRGSTVQSLHILGHGLWQSTGGSIRAIIAILQVNTCLSNQVIGVSYNIPVHDCYLQNVVHWQPCRQLEWPPKYRIKVRLNVIISVINGYLASRDLPGVEATFLKCCALPKSGGGLSTSLPSGMGPVYSCWSLVVVTQCPKGGNIIQSRRHVSIVPHLPWWCRHGQWCPQDQWKGWCKRQNHQVMDTLQPSLWNTQQHRPMGLANPCHDKGRKYLWS